MVSAPTASVVVFDCATPLRTIAVPIKAPLLKKATVPVAAAGVMAAVNVALPPNTRFDDGALTIVVVFGKPLFPVVPAAPPPVAPPEPVWPFPNSSTTSNLGID
jgi:hypothetical protein